MHIKRTEPAATARLLRDTFAPPPAAPDRQTCLRDVVKILTRAPLGRGAAADRRLQGAAMPLHACKVDGAAAVNLTNDADSHALDRDVARRCHAGVLEAGS